MISPSKTVSMYYLIVPTDNIIIISVYWFYSCWIVFFYPFTQVCWFLIKLPKKPYIYIGIIIIIIIIRSKVKFIVIINNYWLSKFKAHQVNNCVQFPVTMYYIFEFVTSYTLYSLQASNLEIWVNHVKIHYNLFRYTK